MGKIMYEVTATIHAIDSEADWVRWIVREHIGDVLAAGAEGGRLVKLDEPDRTYVVQYEFSNREALERYLREEAPRLRAEGVRAFSSERVGLHRRIGEVMNRPA